jgi:hypothetical protein
MRLAKPSVLGCALLLSLVGCGGGGSGGKGGADGGAGTGGQGGQSGQAGQAGQAGHGDGAAGNDAAPSDAAGDGPVDDGHPSDARDGGDAPADSGGTDAPNACATSLDGGNGCTTTLAASNGYDFFCGVKDGAAVKCWGSAAAASTVTLTAPVVAASPAGLRSLSISNAVATDQTFCGVDGAGRASCWNTGGTQSLGTGVRSVTVSSVGVCRLFLDGSLACDTGITRPTGSLYLQIAASEDVLAALDAPRAVFFPSVTFPTGTYDEVAANDGRRVGAVRDDDGAVVTFHGTTQMVHTGSFAHVALDGANRACAIGTTGEVTCWSIDASAPAPGFASLPSGPFLQIVGAKASFCALRPTGTTACWGDQAIDVPAGW